MTKLLAKRVIDPETGCWLNQGNHGKLGLRMVSVEGTKYIAYRLSYEAFFGTIPDGLFVCHRCDEPCCFNPWHLFLGTAAENSADMVAKGRNKKGSKHPNSKLVEEQVEAILRDPRTSKTIAADYGVDESLIYQIRKGTIWRHVSS